MFWFDVASFGVVFCKQLDVRDVVSVDLGFALKSMRSPCFFVERHRHETTKRTMCSTFTPCHPFKIARILDIRNDDEIEWWYSFLTPFLLVVLISVFSTRGVLSREHSGSFNFQHDYNSSVCNSSNLLTKNISDQHWQGVFRLGAYVFYKFYRKALRTCQMGLFVRFSSS